MVVQPKDAEYPHVPTPKELELSRRLVDLQQEKDQREQKLIDQIDDLEAQVHKLHERIHDLSQSLQATKREQMHRQQQAAEEERSVWRAKVDALQLELDQEKHDKDAQRKWQRKFSISASPADHRPNQRASTRGVGATPAASGVDPADDVFAKFAQSIALLPASSAGRAAQAGVLPFLAHLLSEDLGDLVTGSVLLALVHLAIHEKPRRPALRRRVLTAPPLSPLSEAAAGVQLRPARVNVKHEIVKAGAAAPLVHILERGTNPRVVVEAARLCAALASYVPNKRVLAAKNAVKHLTRLLTPSLPDALSAAESVEQQPDATLIDRLPLPGDDETQQAALSALVNLAYDSEILRSQIVNFGFLPTAVRFVHESANLRVRCEAAKLVGNLAYNHVVNQSAAMTCESDVALATCLSAETLHRCPELVRASAIGVANLAFTSVNQLAIGYGDATTGLLQLAVDATSPSVLEAVLSALTCLCHQNPLNKSRVAAQNGLQVLLYVLAQSKRYGHDESTLLCKKATSAELLEASASAVCALIPLSSERAAMLADSHESKLETNRVALSALERAKHLLSQQQVSPTSTIPSWLTLGIETLTAYAAGGASSPNSILEAGDDAGTEGGEFREHSYFSLESLTDIAPDEFCPHLYD
ncbi:hypothetical protein PybrP1_005860 [[Pythium] brassicae (nom. inval.)]|nr:hypothetical protein PybrP1_005860 [[Pythium] brassicae (nom. inval.)]